MLFFPCGRVTDREGAPLAPAEFRALPADADGVGHPRVQRAGLMALVEHVGRPIAVGPGRAGRPVQVAGGGESPGMARRRTTARRPRRRSRCSSARRGTPPRWVLPASHHSSGSNAGTWSRGLGGSAGARDARSGMTAGLAHQAASQAHDAGQWLASRSPRQVAGQVQSLAHRRPAAFLVLAAGRAWWPAGPPEVAPLRKLEVLTGSSCRARLRARCMRRAT